MRSLGFLVLVAVLLPAAAARAEEAQDGYPESGWTDDRSGYDVSVDVNGGATFDTFQAPLSPYGEWVTAGGYGTVWRPRVADGWRPYYYGRWEWTNEGWLWVSDEPYGWAVYHYGRWAHDPYYGWIWVPGYEWAPAWVSWRTSGDVVGWAPLAPGLSVYVSTYPFVDFWWTFVPTARFVSVPVYTSAYAPTYTRQWFQRTAPAPARPAPAPGLRPAPAPAPAWGGPAPRFVADRIGRPLTPARIVQAPAPGARGRPGEIPVYRPGPAPSRRPEVGRVPAPAFAPPRAEPNRGPAATPPPGWNGRAPGGGWVRPEPPHAVPPRASPAPAAPPRAAPPSAPPPTYRPEPRREAPAQAPRSGEGGGGRGDPRGERGENQSRR